MILVDSSVWIDYFRGTDSAAAIALDALLGQQPIAIGDLVATEVLQGCRDARDAARVERAFQSLDWIVIGGRDIALQAARHHRQLRALGITVRKTIDTLIATRCIADGIELLHHDRDFDPFEQHLGLRCVGRPA